MVLRVYLWLLFLRLPSFDNHSLCRHRTWFSKRSQEGIFYFLFRYLKLSHLLCTFWIWYALCVGKLLPWTASWLPPRLRSMPEHRRRRKNILENARKSRCCRKASCRMQALTKSLARIRALLSFAAYRSVKYVRCFQKKSQPVGRFFNISLLPRSDKRRFSRKIRAELVEAHVWLAFIKQKNVS